MDETINLRSEDIQVSGYVKAIDGTTTKINTRKIVAAGGIYVEAEIPDINDPFYIVIDTPPGRWISDDFNISESNLKAYFMRQDNN